MLPSSSSVSDPARRSSSTIPREHKQSVTFADLHELKFISQENPSIEETGHHVPGTKGGFASALRHGGGMQGKRVHSTEYDDSEVNIIEGLETTGYRRGRSTSSPASQFDFVSSLLADDLGPSTFQETGASTHQAQYEKGTNEKQRITSQSDIIERPTATAPISTGYSMYSPSMPDDNQLFHRRTSTPNSVVSSSTEETNFGWGYLLQAATYLLVALTFPFSLFTCLRVIAQYERAVIFRLGRLLPGGAKGPGLTFLLPCIDKVHVVDLRTFTFDVPTQEVLTKDSVTVVVAAVVYYRIFDPIMSVVNVEDANRSTRLLAQTTLRNVLGTVDLYHLLVAREQIAHQMQACLDSATDVWGVKVERTEIKDVRLPTMLQRAMAAEAEAAREARAKVIMAEGEQRAAEALHKAAVQLSDCPIAMQLRYLQTLNTISSEKNSTIIFPFPLEFTNLIHRYSNSFTKTDFPSGSFASAEPSAPLSSQPLRQCLSGEDDIV